MEHGRKRLLRCAFAALLGFALLALAPIALAAESTGLSKSKTSSEYELSPSLDTTTITLSLPSEEYLDTFDVVFVVDSSNESELLEAEACELMDALLAEDLNVNIGVIKFKGLPQDTIYAVSDKEYSGLTPLNDETRSFIEEAIAFNPDTDPRSTTGNGTNIHSALLLAEEWLDASDTPNDHKYVLQFTDGRAYIFDDGDGNPTAIYAQYHRNGITTNRLMYDGSPAISSNYEADKYHKTIGTGSYFFKDSQLADMFDDKVVKFGTSDTHSASDFQLLYDSPNPELTSTSPYETSCYYVGSGTSKNNKLGDGVETSTPGEWSTYFKSGASLFGTYYSPTGVSDNEPYLQLSPLMIDDNGDYTGELNDDYWMFHVSSEEKALYLAAHTWTDLGSKYHALAVINDRGYNAGLETCADYLKWLPENSELSAAVKDSAALAALFDELENQLVYAVGKAIVVDEIPSYLDLVEDAYDGIPFQLTVSGQAQNVALISENDWGFGPNDGGGNYPYEVRWSPDSREFTLYINVPVENANAVVLKYDLKWNGTGTEDVDVDTNASTTIEYWASNKLDGPSKTEDYTSPVVIYHSPVPCKVTYDPNGGLINGSPDNYIVDTFVGEEITIIAAPTREGYIFKYWEGSEYYPGDTYTVPGDHTFVAQWEKDPTPKTGDDARGTMLALAAMTLGSICIAGAALTLKRRASRS